MTTADGMIIDVKATSLLIDRLVEEACKRAMAERDLATTRGELSRAVRERDEHRSRATLAADAAKQNDAVNAALRRLIDAAEAFDTEVFTAKGSRPMKGRGAFLLAVRRAKGTLAAADVPF